MFIDHDHAPTDQCELCGCNAPVAHVTFRQNVGLLVLRFSTASRGFFCRNCIDQEFWRRTLTTLFFGPWGVISFFLTPIFIIGNVSQYFSARSLPRPDGPRAQGARWVLPAILLGGLVVACPMTCLVSAVVLGGFSEARTGELAAACEGLPVPSAAPLVSGEAPGVVMMERDQDGWFESSSWLLPESIRGVDSTRDAALVICIDDEVPSTIETCAAGPVARTVLQRHGRVIVARTGELVGESTAMGTDPDPCPLTASQADVLEGDDPLYVPASLDAAFGPLVRNAQSPMAAQLYPPAAE